MEKARLLEIKKLKATISEVRQEQVQILSDILRTKLKEDLDQIDMDSMLIEDMDLSVRSYNCLKRSGINTIGDLRKMNLWKLRHVRNLGRRSQEEIITRYEIITRQRFDMTNYAPDEPME